MYDNVLAIDDQLQRLQSEVAMMDQEFANYQPPSYMVKQEADAKKKQVSFQAPKPQAQTKEARYQNLPQLNQPAQPLQSSISRLKPQITKDYVRS